MYDNRIVQTLKESLWGRGLDQIITALCHHIKSPKVVTDEPVSAIIPLVIEEQPVSELPLKRVSR
jgi:hypothetical protein